LVAEERHSYAQLPFVPSREVLGDGILALLQVQVLQQFRNVAFDIFRLHSFESADEVEVLNGGEVFEEDVVLLADAHVEVLEGGQAALPLFIVDLPFGGRDQPGQHRDGRGLPCPIMSQEHKYLAFVELEGEVVDDEVAGVLLGEVLYHQTWGIRQGELFKVLSIVEVIGFELEAAGLFEVLLLAGRLLLEVLRGQLLPLEPKGRLAEVQQVLQVRHQQPQQDPQDEAEHKHIERIGDAVVVVDEGEVVGLEADVALLEVDDVEEAPLHGDRRDDRGQRLVLLLQPLLRHSLINEAREEKHNGADYEGSPCFVEAALHQGDEAEVGEAVEPEEQEEEAEVAVVEDVDDQKDAEAEGDEGGEDHVVAEEREVVEEGGEAHQVEGLGHASLTLVDDSGDDAVDGDDVGEDQGEGQEGGEDEVEGVVLEGGRLHGDGHVHDGGSEPLVNVRVVVYGLVPLRVGKVEQLLEDAVGDPALVHVEASLPVEQVLQVVLGRVPPEGIHHWLLLARNVLVLAPLLVIKVELELETAPII